MVAEEVLSRPLLSLLIKNGSPFHSSALRVSSYTTFSAKKKTNMFSVFKNILAQISVISNHMALGRTPASAKLLQQVCTSVNGRL